MLGLLLGLVDVVSTAIEAGGCSVVGSVVIPGGDGLGENVAEVGKEVGSDSAVETKVLVDGLGLYVVEVGGAVSRIIAVGAKLACGKWECGFVVVDFEGVVGALEDNGLFVGFIDASSGNDSDIETSPRVNQNVDSSSKKLPSTDISLKNLQRIRKHILEPKSPISIRHIAR